MVNILTLLIIITIVLGVRRLPYTVRGTFASLLVVHKSYEVAALGFILLLVGAIRFILINRIAGTKMGGVFG